MSLPVGKKNCPFFWCVEMDCSSYNNGAACSGCNIDGTCGNCILFDSRDGCRPSECRQRLDDIQRGYAYAVDVDY